MEKNGEESGNQRDEIKHKKWEKIAEETGKRRMEPEEEEEVKGIERQKGPSNVLKKKEKNSLSIERIEAKTFAAVKWPKARKKRTKWLPAVEDELIEVAQIWGGDVEGIGIGAEGTTLEAVAVEEVERVSSTMTGGGGGGYLTILRGGGGGDEEEMEWNRE